MCPCVWLLLLDGNGFCTQYPLCPEMVFVNFHFQDDRQHGRYIENGRWPKLYFPYFEGIFCIHYLFNIGSELTNFYFQDGRQHGHYIENGRWPKLYFLYFDGIFAYSIFSTLAPSSWICFFKMAASMGGIFKMSAQSLMFCPRLIQVCNLQTGVQVI